MALVKDTYGKFSNGAHRKMVASGSIAVADMPTQTDDHVVFELPAGAVTTAGATRVTTAFDGTAAAIDVDLVDLDGDNNIVLDAAVSKAAGNTAMDGAGIGYGVAPLAAPHYCVVRSDDDTSTTGAVTVEVEYYIQGRSDENTG